LVSTGRIVEVEARRAVAVIERWPREIERNGERAPTQGDAIRIAALDTQKPGTGALPLVHHHQLQHAVPAATEHVAAAGFDEFCRYVPSHGVTSFWCAMGCGEW
jgi:hypothetical protein